MEIKGSMGLPSSGPGGFPSSFNGTHPKSSGDMQAHEAHTHAHMPPPFRVDSNRVVSPPMMVSPPIAATPLAASPLPYMPDMSTAMMSHTGALVSLGAHPLTGYPGSDSIKKKRGRPRKYGPDGTVSIVIKPFSSLTPSSTSPLQKRGRGRPPGSGKHQQLAALGELICGSAGVGFTPHAITVATGEDVAARIMSFSQQGPRGICILSANGAISNVTLRQPSSAGGTVTYEGRFEILSLSGSFLLTDINGTRSRTGGLSVSLAGPDGRVVGGGIAGILMAASPVQVVVGSFICGGAAKKAKQPKADGASKVSVVAGDPKIEGGNAAQEPQATTDTKGESPAPNQSSGNGACSDAESPRGQMIAVHSNWPATAHGVQESRRNIGIDISSPGQ